MRKLLLSIVFSCIFLTCFAQGGYDTLTVMQYNLMYFNTPSPPGNCSPLSKEIRSRYLSTIIGYVLPDVFTVNEMNDDAITPQFLLENALNSDTRNYYDRAAYVAEPGDQITNMLFYNKNKLRLVSQQEIDCEPRNAHIYTLKHKEKQSNNDSATLHFVVVHLKSSSPGSTERGASATNGDRRGACATAIMNHFQANYSNSKANLFVMGDFNLYATSEKAYVNFTTNSNTSIRLFDPVYTLSDLNTNTGAFFYKGENMTIPKGDLSEVSALAPYYTQSPILTANRPCQATSGMDDRFDYILTNASVLNDSAYVNYIPGSYKALGNDGKHYDQAINNGVNTIVSPLVLDALFNNSDHLPVVAKFRIPTSIASYLDPSITFAGFNLTVGGNSANLAGLFLTDSPGNKSFQLSGGAASLSGSNLVAISEGTVTVTGKVDLILGYNRGEKTIVVTISPKPKPIIDPNLVQGKFTTNIDRITITTANRTITGTYIISAPNGITITGTSLSVTGALLSGVFVGEQTISGNNISFHINNVLIPTSVEEAISIKDLKAVIKNNCLQFASQLAVSVEAAVYELSGRLVWKKTLAAGETYCNFPGIPAGIYVLKVQGMMGEPKYVQKLLID